MYKCSQYKSREKLWPCDATCSSGLLLSRHLGRKRYQRRIGRCIVATPLPPNCVMMGIWSYLEKRNMVRTSWPKMMWSSSPLQVRAAWPYAIINVSCCAGTLRLVSSARNCIVALRFLSRTCRGMSSRRKVMSDREAAILNSRKDLCIDFKSHSPKGLTSRLRYSASEMWLKIRPIATAIKTRGREDCWNFFSRVIVINPAMTSFHISSRACWFQWIVDSRAKEPGVSHNVQVADFQLTSPGLVNLKHIDPAQAILLSTANISDCFSSEACGSSGNLA